MNGAAGNASGHRLSASTVKGTGTRRIMEGDGILQMLRWLNRTPESFLPGHSETEAARERLPDAGPQQLLRFDTRKIHAALDAERGERNLTWAQVAREIRVGVSSLTHLSKGGRTGFPQVMRIVGWLGLPAAHFTKASNS